MDVNTLAQRTVTVPISLNLLEINPMKKSLLALAAFGTFAGAVHAQSSVTLYGILDAGIQYVNNAGGQHLYQASSGNVQGDRWGLRGTEDLGGGLKAIFVLENGFNIFNGKLGQGGDEFGRQAYVGLTSPYGTVTLGRQYDSVVDYVDPLEVASQWATFYAAHAGDMDDMNNTNHMNNSIKYASPNYHGITFGGAFSLGGVAGNFSQNRIWTGGIGYAQGPITLGAAYLNIRNPNYSFWGNNAASNVANTATGSNNMTNRIFSGYASAQTQQVIAAGGAYSIGPATLGLTYSNIQFKNLGSTAGVGLNPAGYNASSAGKFHNVEVSAKYQITPAFLAGAAWNYTHAYGQNHANYNQAVAGIDYFLSKRTDVYLDGIYMHASGTDSSGRAAVANINGLSASSTQNQITALAGIRHKF
jgi:predicted porin